MKYTLGLDVGTNSLGWAILKLNKDGAPEEIEKLGSRIFSDGRNPKDQTTLASSRRQKRHERRRRDRFLQRKKLVLNQLIKMGLFPKIEEEQQELKNLDVLTLRAKAASEKISAYELGRVLYYLNLRRGFKSNRKQAGSDEDKKNKISERIQKLQNELTSKNFKTVGQYLHDRYKSGLSTKATIENEFHLLRDLIENEYDTIVAQQKTYHKDITNADWDNLRGKIFHQRPLKPVETGSCSLYPEEFRTFKFLPSFEYYRFFTELFNLSYQDPNFNTHNLTLDQIFQAFHKFKHNKEVPYSKLKKFLKIDVKFSMEETKEKIKNSATNSYFSNDLFFGDSWAKLPLSIKDQIAEIFFSDEEDSMKIREKLASLKVEEEILDNLFSVPPLIKLPSISEVTCSYSSKALQKIVSLIEEEKRHPALIVDDLFKNEARDHVLSDKLGYYGASVPESMQPIPSHIKNNNPSLNEDEKRYGKIANPTVHAALNQIKIVVNELIVTYGKPENVHIEFARDLKKSKADKDEDNKKRKINEDRNQRVKEFIEKHKESLSSFNFERVKLWFELDAMNNQMCVYSGKTISARMVLSDEVQVDHILPFSRTLDDSLSNKVLVLASENVKKRNKTPFEAFGKDVEKWAAIQERAKKLPYNKQWRFASEAISKFEKEDKFLSRHINDTRYISKIAKKYLGNITDQSKIVSSKGQMTSIIRGKLGLNQFIQNSEGKKDRDDHRHHAIDALTVALTSRSYLKKISDASAKHKDPNKIPVPQPWEGFIKEVEKQFNQVIVSHKVDHGTNGPFMEETCLGLVKNPNEYENKNNFKLITTKARSALTDKNIDVIRSKTLQNTAEKKGIDGLSKEIKKLRVYEVSKEDLEEIGSINSGLAKVAHGRNKQHTKFYQKGDINYLAIWYLPKDITLKQDFHKKRKSDYIFSAVKTFDLNSKNPNELKPHPAAKLVTKIFKNDSLALEINGKLSYFILKSIRAANGQLYFLEINRSKEAADKKQFLLTFSKLVEYKFRKIFVTSTGVIKDNGPILK